MITMPLIFESGVHGERAYDIFSKLMTQRVIFIGQPIDSILANIVCAQLNYLDNNSDDPINIYINSPGGSVTDTLAIYDTMQYVRNEVHTLCIGQAASGAALILLSGTPGCRRALKNAEIMLHQPSGGSFGKVTDLVSHVKQMDRLKNICKEIVVEHTKISEDDAVKLLEWDAFMTSNEAVERGIIDEIIKKKTKQSWI